jgi:uncharacterized protein (DUF3820 family)
MPFGKHKGESLEDIPVEYLDWLIGQDWMDEKPALKKIITDHLSERPEWQQMGED